MKKRKLTERISDALEMPRDVLSEIPRIVIVGDGKVHIEGFCGIAEYSAERIVIRIKKGVISMSGEKLKIEEITEDFINIKGFISSVEFK